MLRIVGDVGFGDSFFDIGFGIGSMVDTGVNPLEHILSESKDLWLGNLECVISDTSIKTGVKAECFRLPIDTFSNLSHLNVYAVANNHLMDHGAVAYNNTLSAVNYAAKHVGSNKKRSILVEHNEIVYGIMAFSSRKDENTKDPLYWYRPEYTEILKEYAEISSADFKIIYMHWGNEFINYPNVDQKFLAHWLIDIGFDLVVGCHSHVMQGYEVYKDKHIFYSLGNFLFNMTTPETRHSAIVNVDFIDNKFKVSYDYIQIDKDCIPKIVSPVNVPQEYTFDYLNKKITIDEDNELYYRKVFKNLSVYRKHNRLKIVKSFNKFEFRVFKEVLFDFVNRHFK